MDSLERLAILSNVLQVGSFFMNANQLSNDDLMKVLEEQDDVFLNKILSNQKEILKKLDEILDKIKKL